MSANTDVWKLIYIYKMLNHCDMKESNSCDLRDNTQKQSTHNSNHFNISYITHGGCMIIICKVLNFLI